MALSRLVMKQKGIGDAALRSPGTRQLIARVTRDVAAGLAAEIGADNVREYTSGGKRRARGYVHRFDIENEAADGALSRNLRSGGGL